MSCAFDRDLIALHAGGDASPQDQNRAAEHLRTCAPCRNLYAEYQQGRALVAEHQANAAYSGPEASPRAVSRWRWATIAVAALLAITLAGVVTESPAVAALLETFGLVKVQVMDKDETAQFRDELQTEWDGRQDLQYDEHGVARDQSGKVISRKSKRVALPLAQKAVEYNLLQPGYLPEGFEPGFASLFPGDPKSPVTLVYGGGMITIDQMAPGAARPVQVSVPDGASETVMVNGEPAVVIRGTWGVGADGGKFAWTPDSPVMLAFTKGEQVVTITVGRRGFPTDELIKIAESLK